MATKPLLARLTSAKCVVTMPLACGKTTITAVGAPASLDEADVIAHVRQQPAVKVTVAGDIGNAGKTRIPAALKGSEAADVIADYCGVAPATVEVPADGRNGVPVKAGK